MREEYEQNLIWAKRVTVALLERRIRPQFQPIMNNRTGEIEKFECLVRMLDEQAEAAPPSRFLHIGKKLRIYKGITLQMVEQVIEAFKGAPYGFSINLNCEDIADGKTNEFIGKKLEEYDLAERGLFELLELEIIMSYEQVHRFIEEFQGLGCKISIDDFGSGYSNFEHLLQLKVDFIKIDGSLIRNLDPDPNAAVITEGIVNFARNLNMLTVAELVHSDSVRKVSEGTWDRLFAERVRWGDKTGWSYRWPIDSPAESPGPPQPRLSIQKRKTNKMLPPNYETGFT